MKKHFVTILVATSILLNSKFSIAQFSTDGYDDYGSFSTDPTDLDNETRELFGRFFQTSALVGTGILVGNLGSAYAAGFLGEFRVVFYFDKTWATELGFGFGQNEGLYNSTNTNAEIDLSLRMNLVPVYIGLRYGFDPDMLARGFSTMNPYLSARGEIFFRSESVIGVPVTTDLSPDQIQFFGQGGKKNDRSFGFSLGGGVEFDVYKKRLLLGMDLRYHVTLWNSSRDFFGDLQRNGNYISILASGTYTY